MKMMNKKQTQCLLTAIHLATVTHLTTATYQVVLLTMFITELKTNSLKGENNIHVTWDLVVVFCIVAVCACI